MAGMSAGMQRLRKDDDPTRADRRFWDEYAFEYLAEHGSILGDADFIWGPEGLREAEAQVLGSPESLAGARILEFGCGAAQCARYLASLGLDVTATDLSAQMLETGRELNAKTGIDVPLIRADARSQPFEDASFDVAFTSFGALPFVERLSDVFDEIARLLVPGGILAYSAVHPIRWMFPDSPYKADMTVTTSYFAPEPYIERDSRGTLAYTEFPHSFAEHMNSLAAAGFVVERVIEPQWPEGRTVVWGAWGPERSAYIPGTLIVRARRA